jgi:hypothetical protein
MITGPAPRCSESSDQFLRAIHVLAISKAKNSATMTYWKTPNAR